MVVVEHSEGRVEVTPENDRIELTFIEGAHTLLSTVELDPKVARQLAFVIIGMTDAKKAEGE